MLSNHQIAPGEFERLALPYLNDLYKAAGRVVRHKDQAEDIVQETYLQAWKSFQRFTPGTNCKAWLFAILFHSIHHHWRRVAAMKTAPEGEDMLAEMPASDAPFVDEITDKNVLAALNEVPHQYREVLLLADVQEFTYKEISDTLKIPIGTVMSRLNRGRNQLRNALLPIAGN